MTNRLAQTQSLYLRKQAENPIDWMPWGEEAIAFARTTKRPIFLSIGYSSCHWCTVMEGEAFSDQAIADYMNANFVAIKVDREERPDLDSIYMQALQMMTGQGGWPLNVFLSPEDLVPFYGGTYFPLEPRYGRPGFLQLLQAIRRYYDTETAKVRSLKEELLSHLQDATNLPASARRIEDFAVLQNGLETATGIISPNNYGSSFPMMPYAELALRGLRFEFESKYDSEEVCRQRGLDLTLGGIYDHIAGGFHRYTVDATWTVPHFEKMLYDNGQIIEFLANLWNAGIQEPAFERAIAGTIEWLKREMTAPAGYFYGSQDADSFISQDVVEPEEGAFYVWSYNLLQQILTEAELKELQEQFTVTVSGNFEGFNVLQRQHPGKLSPSLETTLGKLFSLRYGATMSNLATFPPAKNNHEVKTTEWPGRIPPVTDTKMIVAWNSLTISGLAKAYQAFQKPEYLQLAAKAANFILENQWIDGRFHRLNYDGQVTVLAQSEDYALFVKALLDLNQASLLGAVAQPAEFWLEQAIQVQAEFDEFLWSLELGGYYNTPKDASGDLLVRERSYADNATPSANGVAIANLIRLFLLTENLSYFNLAEQGLQAFSIIMHKSPQACPSLFTALDWYRHLTLIQTTKEELSALISQYLPVGILKVNTALPEGAIALVCQGLSCQAPARSREQLQKQLQQSQIR